MPGVLIDRGAWRRPAASCCCTTCRDRAATKLLYFTGIERARFRRPVVPGDQLRLEVEVLRLRERFARLAGKAIVDGELAPRRCSRRRWSTAQLSAR